MVSAAKGESADRVLYGFWLSPYLSLAAQLLTEAGLGFVGDYQVHFSSVWMLWAGVVLLRRPSVLGRRGPGSDRRAGQRRR